MQRGFSTLEAVLAMAIFVSAIAAVMLTESGNQSLLADGALAGSAREDARALLAEEAARALKDFNLVNPIRNASASASARVSLLPDYLTKLVTAAATWKDELGRTHTTELSTLLTNFEHATGGDTCSSALEGDWSSPTAKSYSLSPGDLLPGNEIGAAVSGLDAYHDTLYVTADEGSGATLFLFDTSSEGKPRFIASVDNARGTDGGLAGVLAAGDYAYLADSHSRDADCMPGTDCAQLQVADVKDPKRPEIVASYLIPTTTPSFVKGSGGQAAGKALAYQDGFLYLGLSKTANGPEFNVIDVRDPGSPKWLGGYGIGRSINAIVIDRGHAYLSTDDNKSGGRAVAVLDISDPKHPYQIASWSAPGAGFANGIRKIGDTLYLGRSYASGAQEEFHELDASRPEEGLPILAGADIGTAAHHASVRSLIIRDTLAFLLTNDDIELWDIGDAEHIGPAAAPIPLPEGSQGIALDCEGNRLYAASNAGDTGYVTILSAR